MAFAHRFFAKFKRISGDWSVAVKSLDPNALYERTAAFFPPTERFFWDLLNQVIGTQYRLFGRTRLLDIISIKSGLPETTIAIARKQAESRYVDFVLCDPMSLAVVGVIELEDDPYQGRSTRKHDAITGRILAAAGIPFIRIKARSDYTALDVKLALMERIPEPVTSSSKDVSVKETPQAASDDTKLCPVCGAPMVKRVVKKGTNIGTEFWGCSAFPKCKTSLSLDET